MRVFHGFDALPHFVRPAVTVGSYDGVHLGHRALIGRLAARINPFGAVMVVSILASAICCNQSLSTVVVKQLCDHVIPDLSLIHI